MYLYISTYYCINGPSQYPMMLKINNMHSLSQKPPNLDKQKNPFFLMGNGGDDNVLYFFKISNRLNFFPALREIFSYSNRFHRI